MVVYWLGLSNEIKIKYYTGQVNGNDHSDIVRIRR